MKVIKEVGKCRNQRHQSARHDAVSRNLISSSSSGKSPNPRCNWIYPVSLHNNNLVGRDKIDTQSFANCNSSRFNFMVWWIVRRQITRLLGGSRLFTFFIHSLDCLHCYEWIAFVYPQSNRFTIPYLPPSLPTTHESDQTERKAESVQLGYKAGKSQLLRETR